MRKSTIMILAILGYFSARTQTCTWIDAEETGYNLNPSAVNYTVCIAPDQTVWFGGLKEKFSQYYQMMGKNFLVHYDILGNRIGTYMINGTLVINVMKCDSAGHLYIAGDFMDQDITFWDGSVLHWNGNSINSFIARVNNAGTIDWGINLNVESGDYAPVADMVFHNGKIYLADDVWLNASVSTIDDTGNFSVFITETDAGILSGLDFDSEGNLYCTGSCVGDNNLFNGVNFPPPTFYNRYLVKYDHSGIPLWVKYSEDVTCIRSKVRVDKDNNIYWTGQLYNSCTFDTITLQGPSWVYDFFLVKMNPQGSALWGREVPQVITGDATIGPLDIIKVMPDNSVTIGGNARGMIDWGNGVITDIGSVNNEAWLLNYSPDGVAQWSKTGAGSYTDLESMDIDLSGNLYFTGVAHDTISFDNLEIYRETFYYPYIVKLENSATGIQRKNLAQHFSVIPDPATDFIKLSPEDMMKGNVDIIDLNGRTVMQFKDEARMDVSSLVPGMYCVKVQLFDGSFLVEKFVKRPQ